MSRSDDKPSRQTLSCFVCIEEIKYERSIIVVKINKTNDCLEPSINLPKKFIYIPSD